MLQVMLARTPHLAAPEIRAWLPTRLRPPQVSSIDDDADGRSDDDAAAARIGRCRCRRSTRADMAYWRLDYF